MDIKLLLLRDGECIRQLPIKRPRTVVGRKKGCKLRIPSASVSRIHCVLIRQPGRLFVKDLGSSNGTLVNGERVEVAELKAGDRLAIGVYVFIVQVDGLPRPPKPSAKPAAKQAAPEPEIAFITEDESANDDDANDMVMAEIIDDEAPTSSAGEPTVQEEIEFLVTDDDDGSDDQADDDLPGFIEDDEKK